MTHAERAFIQKVEDAESLRVGDALVDIGSFHWLICILLLVYTVNGIFVLMADG
jgi:hypothetical protein